MFNFEFKHPKFSDKLLNESICEILENNTLLSMATVTENSKAYINTAFYSYDDNLDLFIITDPKTNHSKNVELNVSVAVSIFNSGQKFWEDDMQGIQMFGICIKTPLLKMAKGTLSFVTRFPVFKKLVQSPEDFAKSAVSVKLYTLSIKSIKLFDEKRFGEEVFIDLKIKD